MAEDILAVFPEQHADKFRLTAAGKVRTMVGDQKCSAYLKIIRTTMPSLFAGPVESVTKDVEGKSNPWSEEGFSTARQVSLTQALIKQHGMEEGTARASSIARAGGSFLGATSRKSKPMKASYERTATGRPERVE
jgi:hypothetical protein